MELDGGCLGGRRGIALVFLSLPLLLLNVVDVEVDALGQLKEGFSHALRQHVYECSADYHVAHRCKNRRNSNRTLIKLNFLSSVVQYRDSGCEDKVRCPEEGHSVEQVLRHFNQIVNCLAAREYAELEGGLHDKIFNTAQKCAAKDEEDFLHAAVVGEGIADRVLIPTIVRCVRL